MGLDMYLNKRIYIGANYEHRNVKGAIEITEGDDNKPIKINLSKVSEITERAAYWRKANQIHRWFVEKIQNGVDDCGDYYVSKEQLKELVDTCEAVLADKDKASELLPSQPGFFFGGTEYDEYFFQDLENTIEQIKPLLEDTGRGDYEYTSSW